MNSLQLQRICYPCTLSNKTHEERITSYFKEILGLRLQKVA
jgi:hypothetical protein